MAIATGSSDRKDRSRGQLSLFDMMSDEDQASVAIQYPDISEIPMDELLKNEKELLGFFLSGHPIDPGMETIQAFQIDDLSDLPELANGTIFRAGAYISNVMKRVSKTTQKPYAILPWKAGRQHARQCYSTGNTRPS